MTRNSFHRFTVAAGLLAAVLGRRCRSGRRHRRRRRRRASGSIGSARTFSRRRRTPTEAIARAEELFSPPNRARRKRTCCSASPTGSKANPICSAKPSPSSARRWRSIPTSGWRGCRWRASISTWRGPARARDELTTALERAPNQPQVLALLGEAERQLGNTAARDRAHPAGAGRRSVGRPGAGTTSASR